MRSLLTMGFFSLLRRRSPWSTVLKVGLGLVAILTISLGLRLTLAAQQPIDAVLVLGGSIRREIYAAQSVAQQPDIPVLISSGSPPPCIFLVFEREQALSDRIWLETCAHNTFENFYYTTPILRRWQARHVQLLTSPSHLPRALWLARIHLGIHGIWVALDPVEETGRPGNTESWLKTDVDVLRSVAWAVVSLVWKPPCDRVRPLTQINLERALRQGFKCEHQGQLDRLIQERQKTLSP